MSEPESIYRAAVVVLTSSDSGFCGAFNNDVLREEQRLVRTLAGERRSGPFVARRTASAAHRARKIEIAQRMERVLGAALHPDATEVTKGLLEAFDKKAEDGGVDGYIVRTESSRRRPSARWSPGCCRWRSRTPS